MEKKYRFTSGKNLLSITEIYKNNPPKEMFLNLLSEHFISVNLRHIAAYKKEYIQWFIDAGLIEEDRPEFKPFDLTIRIQTEDEYLVVWHRLNMAKDHMEDYFMKCALDGTVMPKNFNHYYLWLQVEKQHEKAGLDSRLK